MKSVFLIVALALSLAGCTSMASGVATVATSMSTSTPAQVNTFADATAAATLATRTVDLAVTSLKLDKATLKELQTLNEAVHAAWLPLKDAVDKGQSPSFAAFNAALAAYQSYRTSQGIPEAKAS